MKRCTLLLAVAACASTQRPAPQGEIATSPRPPAIEQAPPIEAPPPSAPTQQEIDCHLDPSMCGAPKATPPATLPSDDRPETLGPPEIRRGIDGVEPQIHECARMHGAPSKLTVLLRVEIAGVSGMVTRASIVKPTLAAGLEHCVIAAAHRATFSRFRKERAGAMLKLELP